MGVHEINKDSQTKQKVLAGRQSNLNVSVCAM